MLKYQINICQVKFLNIKYWSLIFLISILASYVENKYIFIIHRHTCTSYIFYDIDTSINSCWWNDHLHKNMLCSVEPWWRHERQNHFWWSASKKEEKYHKFIWSSNYLFCWTFISIVCNNDIQSKFDWCIFLSNFIHYINIYNISSSTLDISWIKKIHQVQIHGL